MKRILFVISLLLLPVPGWAQGSLLGDVAAERSKYGAVMSPAQVAAMLNQVAWNHRGEGWGLLRKGAGNSCPLGGTFVSCDILVNSFSRHHFDVLQDAENTARPQWNDVGMCELGPSSGCDMSNFLAPIDPGAGGSPIPSPVPSPSPVPVPTPTVDLSPVLTQLAVSYEQRERMFADLVARLNALSAQNEAFRVQLEKHDNQPAWAAKFFGNRYVQMLLAAGGTYVGRELAK